MMIDDKRQRKRGLLPETEARYSAALELYRTTALPVAAICKQTHTSPVAFRSYLCRCHRELMFARNGMNLSPQEAATAGLRKPSGQSEAAYKKYHDAIRACADRAYLECNVSQIAHLFNLAPTSLGNQLRTHYPEILEFRERERHRLGLNDNLHRGVKPWCKEQYAAAVEHLRTSDDTLKQTAAMYGLSYTGLREHLLYYHRELVGQRADRRRRAKANTHIGGLTGNGSRHEPMPEQVEKYREAVRLYRTTVMTRQEIAAATGVPLQGLCNHLRIWHRDLILEHRGIRCRRGKEIPLSGTKHYLKSTAAKYAGAIRRLKQPGHTIAEVAKEFGLHPESFRMYLHEHEPALAAGLGMKHLPNGKLVSARSYKKYSEAVRLYASTPEPLKSIAARLNLTYNSVSGFIRRNCPNVILSHKQLLAGGSGCKVII